MTGSVVGVAAPLGVILGLPGVMASVGLVLFFVLSWRHLGRKALLAAGIAVAVGLVVVASSARNPGGW